jgi:hypothetical protein
LLLAHIVVVGYWGGLFSLLTLKRLPPFLLTIGTVALQVG